MPIRSRSFASASASVAPRALVRDVLPLVIVLGIVVAALWLLASPLTGGTTQGIEMAPFRWGPGANQGVA
jgi:hypothetical protein